MAPHIPRALGAYRKSYALLSSADKCDRLVVFVHGFGGKPTGTWRNFQSLVDDLQDKFPWWREADLVFYYYESRRAIQISAQNFSSFLDDIVRGEIEQVTEKPDVMPRSLFTEPPPIWNRRTYRELTLVAHSEGAVVVRRALLDRLGALGRKVAAGLRADARPEEVVDLVNQRAEADLILQAKLRLFAPACLGTNFSSMFGFAVAYSDILHALASSIAARNDLGPNSPIIAQILRDTEAASQRYRLNAFRAKILFGDKDHVVHVGGYNCDEVVRCEVGQTHSGICKPIAPYLRPLGLYDEF